MTADIYDTRRNKFMLGVMPDRSTLCYDRKHFIIMMFLFFIYASLYFGTPWMTTFKVSSFACLTTSKASTASSNL